MRIHGTHSMNLSNNGLVRIITHYWWRMEMRELKILFVKYEHVKQFIIMKHSASSDLVQM